MSWYRFSCHNNEANVTFKSDDLVSYFASPPSPWSSGRQPTPPCSRPPCKLHICKHRMLLTSCQNILLIQLSRARLQQCFTFLLVVESVLDVNRLRGQNSHRCNPFFIRSMYFLLMMIIEKKSNKVIIHFTNSSSASLSP